MMERIRFIFAEGLVMWAYACLINQYTAASAAIALLALFPSFAAFDRKRQLRILPAVLVLSLAGLILIRGSSLQAYLPAVGIVMIAGIHTSLIYPYYYPQETEGTMRGLLLSALIFLILEMMTPSDVFNVADMMLLLLLIFGPAIGMYGYSLLKESGAKPVAGDTAMR